MRVIVPPTGSQFISLLKGTSLVSVIAMADLLYSVQVIYNRTYEIVPLLIVACAWYLVVVTVPVARPAAPGAALRKGAAVSRHAGPARP